ncbi:6cb624c1-9f60-4dc7-b790-d09e3bc5e7f7 [Thermothielavioides terrestris]|uniref:6cb624c1-9f60-4dc7-b790-d09e3bc5e7f7 n=1 Tax=Thermothielavioides terrestris TaxID=2587410 RepID=A0A3S4D408_9PEZI|nr:6cb624c1-9f60-4dc7-b790-d09e3bc5e7f7 [Thermothielavioides terrestris]
MAPPNIPLATRLLPLILLLLLPLLPGPTSAEILGALTITNALTRREGGGGGGKAEVQGLTRVADTHLNSTDFLFALVDDQSKETSCSVAVPGSDPTASWYGRSCVVHPNYSISWGYIKETDSAVMTVCE